MGTGSTTVVVGGGEQRLTIKGFPYLFLERGEGREKERERSGDMREKRPSVASQRCPYWDWTQSH